MLIPEENVIPFVFLLKHLLLSYFLDEYCTLAVYDENYQEHELQMDYMDALEEAVGAANYTNRIFIWIKFHTNESDSSLEYEIAKAIEIGCQSYITILKDHNREFVDMQLSIMSYSKQRHKDPKFLMLVDDNYDLIENIFDTRDINYLPNLLVVGKNNDLFVFYSHRYNGIPRAELDVVILDHLYSNESFENDANLYPDKLFDLQSSEMNIGIINFLPYVKMDEVEPGTGNVDGINVTRKHTLLLDGSDSFFLLEFCKLRNCSLKLKLYGIDDWGEIYENGSSYGLVGGLYKNEVEIVVGCVYSWYYEFFELSFPTAKSAVVILVPRALPLPESLTPIYPFTSMLWIVLLVSLIILIITHYFISYKSEIILRENDGSMKSSLSMSAFLIITLVLEQSIGEHSKQLSIRLFITCILVLGLIISNSYSGGLASVLTVPKYEPSVDTIHQFAERNLTWGTPSVAWVFTLYEAKDEDSKTMVRNFQELSHRDLYELPFQRKLSVGVERLTGGNYGFGTYIKNDSLANFDMMKVELYFDYAVINTQRGWPVLKYLNKYVLEVLQHGLYDKWERLTVNKYFDYKIQAGLHELAAGHRDGVGVAPLNVKHVSGALFILSSGLLMAFLSFLIEVNLNTILNLLRFFKI